MVMNIDCEKEILLKTKRNIWYFNFNNFRKQEACSFILRILGNTKLKFLVDKIQFYHVLRQVIAIINYCKKTKTDQTDFSYNFAISTFMFSQ